MSLKIDVDSLTIAEVETIEEASGCPIAWLANEDKPKAKLMRAVVWVVMRRDDPAFTWEQAGAVEIMAVMGGAGSNPPVAAG